MSRGAGEQETGGNRGRSGQRSGVQWNKRILEQGAGNKKSMETEDRRRRKQGERNSDAGSKEQMKDKNTGVGEQWSREQGTGEQSEEEPKRRGGRWERSKWLVE